MLKKSLAIGLSVVMAAEVLTGCSGGSGTTETKAADTGKQKQQQARQKQKAVQEKKRLLLCSTIWDSP